MSAHFITGNRDAAKHWGLALFVLGAVLLVDAYRGQDAPWPLRLAHPML